MGLGHSPRIVTENLVLALDAGNPKNYNVGISTNWTDKVGGNNGTLVGGTHHNDGPFVGAGYVEFAKSDNDGFNISNSTGWFNPNNTSQWTLEGWILNPSITNQFAIYSGTWGAVANFGFSIGGGVAFQSGNGAWSWVTNSNIVADTGSPTGWIHFACTKNGSTFEVFLNGSRIYTGTPTFGTGGTGGSIHLQSYFSNTLYYNDAAGLSNVRYVTGSVLYSGTSYTIPTEPLTAISGTQLLIYQGNTFTDASPNNLTLTVQNSPTARLGFPASAFEFDGTDDYVSIPASSDLDFGSGDFTIEFFLYSASFSDYTGILGKRNSEIDYAPLLIDTDNSAQKKMRFLTSTTGSSWISIVSSSAFPLSQWVHVAVVRSGSTITLYENGVSKGSASISGSIISNSVPVFVGAGVLTISGSARFNGFLSNLRIYKGKGLTQEEVQQNYNALKGRYV